MHWATRHLASSSRLLTLAFLLTAACAGEQVTDVGGDAGDPQFKQAAKGRKKNVPVAVAVSPDSVVLAPGQSQQFAAKVQMRDGSSVTYGVTFAATGGAVTSTGLYTAGSAAGTYRVIATTSGKADTSRVTITAAGPAPSTCPAGATVIAVGDNWQSKVNAAPIGSTFCVATGTHVRQSVVPKSGQKFYGVPGAVMDGQSATTFAFNKGYAPYPSNVEIRGLEIKNYTNPAQYGAIQAGDHTAAEGTRGWVVADCDIHNNVGFSIRIGHKMQVLRNKLHHNGQMGLGGVGDSVLVEGNEIAYNNAQHSNSAGWEAGGFKFVRTRWLTVRNNYSHHNGGPGMWTDGWNIHTLYEGNRVEDNDGVGIFHEISLDAVIRNNTVLRNGLKPEFIHWGYGAGILVASSPNVEVYGNIVTNNARGIVGIGSPRPEDPALFVLHDFYVHDNTVTMTNVATDASGTGNGTGIVQDAGDLTYFTGKNNRFVHNTYHLGSAASYFYWMNGMRSEAQWRGYGQDLTGTFIR